MENEILTSTGKAFAKKAPLVAVLQHRGLKETHKPVEIEGRGWVGRPKGIESVEAMGEVADPPADEKQPQKEPVKLIRCKVFRSNVDPDNKDLPISIIVNEKSSKKVFMPGQEVELTQAHLNVLRDSVGENRLSIPPESGIYESANPTVLAKEFYPSMTPEVDPASGTITMVGRTPNYIVERL